MPYQVRKSPSGKWCVYNTVTGANKGESASKSMAEAHMRALYAAENKKK